MQSISRKTFLIIIALFLLLAICYVILPYSIPLILACFTAFLLEPLIKILTTQTKKLNRKMAVILVFLCFLLLIGFIFYIFSTKVFGSIIQFVENAPRYINYMNEIWIKVDQNLYKASKSLPSDFVTEISLQVEKFIIQLKEDITSNVNIENVKLIFTNIPKLLLNLLVYLIALFLFLFDLPKIKETIYSHLSEKTTDKVKFMSSRLSYVIFNFLKAPFLISIIIFLVSLICLLYIKPKIAFIIAFIIWAVDFVPIIGSIIVLGPWSAFSLLTGEIALGTKLAIFAAILLIIRRTVESKIMKNHIGLSSLSNLISMYLGFKLIGFIGIIIGPLLVIVFKSAQEAGIIKLTLKL